MQLWYPEVSFSHNIFYPIRYKLHRLSHLTLSKTSSGFLRVCSTSLLKTLWAMEKLLVTSNFSIAHSVFYLNGELCAIFIKFKIVVWILLQFGRVQYLTFGKGLKFVDNRGLRFVKSKKRDNHLSY